MATRPVQAAPTENLSHMGYQNLDKLVPLISNLGAQIAGEALSESRITSWIPTAAKAAGGMPSLIQKALNKGFANLLKSIEGREDALLKEIAESALEDLNKHLEVYEKAKGSLDPSHARVTLENADGDVEFNVEDRKALEAEILEAMASLGYSHPSLTGSGADATKKARLEALSESIIKIMFPDGKLPLEDLPRVVHFFLRGSINATIIEKLKTQILPTILEKCVLDPLRDPHTTYKLINTLLTPSKPVETPIPSDNDSGYDSESGSPPLTPIDATVTRIPADTHWDSVSGIAKSFTNIAFPGLLAGLSKFLSVITFGKVNLNAIISTKIDSVVNNAFAQLNTRELLENSFEAGRKALFNANGTPRAHVVTPEEIETSRQSAVKKIRDLLAANTVGLLTGWATRFNEYARTYTGWGASAIKTVNFLRSSLGTLLIVLGNTAGKVPFLWWMSSTKVHEYLQQKAELIVDELSSPAMEVFYLSLLEESVAAISRYSGHTPEVLPVISIPEAPQDQP